MQQMTFKEQQEAMRMGYGQMYEGYGNDMDVHDENEMQQMMRPKLKKKKVVRKEQPVQNMEVQKNSGPNIAPKKKTTKKISTGSQPNVGKQVHQPQIEYVRGPDGNIYAVDVANMQKPKKKIKKKTVETTTKKPTKKKVPKEQQHYDQQNMAMMGQNNDDRPGQEVIEEQAELENEIEDMDSSVKKKTCGCQKSA